jgi:hypothetical protein
MLRRDQAALRRRTLHLPGLRGLSARSSRHQQSGHRQPERPSPFLQRDLCKFISWPSVSFDGHPNTRLTKSEKWNTRSGWDDTFSSTTWDARQRAYVTRWKRQGLFTPQVIIDGVADGACRKEGEFNEVLSLAIEARNASPLAVGVERANTLQVKIASETNEAETHDVVIISYAQKTETVKVGKGPNKGKKLAHVNVVKSVAKVDEWAGGPKVVELPDLAAMGDLQHVMVVQQGVGGQIIAACKL